jgi:hypothetical protein
MTNEDENLLDGSSQPSLFNGFRDTCPHAVTWDEVYHLISSETLREPTERFRYYRSVGLDADAQRIKSKAPSVTPAVQCRGGRRMEQITGYSLGDFDGIPADDLPRCVRLLCGDEHAFMVYTTYSGKGVRVIYKVDSADTYSEAFRQGNEYFAALIGHAYDPQCKNPARLSSLCYDPQAFYRPDAAPLHITPKPKAPKPKSATARKRREYSAPTVEASIAVLAELEQQGLRYEPGRHNDYISRAAYLLNRYGVPQADTLTWALEHFADYGTPQVEEIIVSCYRHTEEHGTQFLPVAGRPETGSKCASVGEIEAFLQGQAGFRYNEVTRQCEISLDHPTDGSGIYTPLTDRDVNTLWSRMNKTLKRTYLQDIYNVIHSEFVPLFNPFRAYFEGLPPWDGVTDHIARLAGMVHLRAGQECFTECFRKWLVGMLPTLFEDGKVNHEILVLVGGQGIYKTTWFNYLLPPELRRYFYTKTNSNRMTKDDQFTLSEFMLVCLEEIDNMRPSELNQLKALTTLPEINERAAYGHNKEHRAHIATLCGTGNNIQFLTDTSGNRRWLPFEVEAVDSPYEHPIDYTGVYSQAYALWRDGFRYWFEQPEVDALKAHYEHFEAPDLESELIGTYYRRPLPGENAVFVTTARILERINAAIRQPLSPTKVGIVMRRQGYESVRSTGQRGFLVIEHTSEEVYANRQSTGMFARAPQEVKEKDPQLPF